MLVFTHRLPPQTAGPPRITLSLTIVLRTNYAEERTRSRFRYTTADGRTVLLRLPRGTVLRHGDLLGGEMVEVLQIAALPEPVLTVTAKTPLELLRVAYHLGNRHVPLEIAPTYLRLSKDPVLSQMLYSLGVEVTAGVLPFQPEPGAYGHPH